MDRGWKAACGVTALYRLLPEGADGESPLQQADEACQEIRPTTHSLTFIEHLRIPVPALGTKGTTRRNKTHPCPPEGHHFVVATANTTHNYSAVQ